MTDAGTNWASLAPKIAFAHNTSFNYTTCKTPYGIVLGTKPQFPMFVNLRLYLEKHKLWCSEFCTDFPPHTYDKNSTKNDLLQKLLRPKFSQALLYPARDFKRINFSSFEQCQEQRPHSHAYRNRFKLGNHLNIGQNVLYENHRQDLLNRQLRLQPDLSLRYNIFCGTLENLKQKIQSTTDLSQTTPILNQLFVPSLARVLSSNRRQFVVAQYSPKFLFRTLLKIFSFSKFSTKCLNVTGFTLTASGRLLFLGQTWHLTQYF